MKIYHQKMPTDEIICFVHTCTKHMLNITKNHYNFLYTLVRKNK